MLVYGESESKIVFSLSPSHSYGNVGDVLLSEVDCYGSSDYLHILRCSYETEVHNCQVDHVILSCSK